MKPRHTMDMAYQDAAWFFRQGGELPSHCDVRCYINNLLDTVEKGGVLVHHGYDQDKAYKQVLKLLKK